MMKTVFIAMLMAMISGAVIAQGCEAYFPVEKGSYRVMESYDKKDKLTGSVKNEVMDIQQTDAGTKYVIEHWSYDKKGKEQGNTELEMVCEDGVFKMDMNYFIDQSMMEGMKDMEVKVDSKDLEIPTNLSVGQELEDASIKIVATNMGIPMVTINTKILDRKVEAREEITTPAGSFDCYKISSRMVMQSFFKAEMTTVEWIAKGVGAVRSESYDDKGNLAGYSILTEFK